MDSSTHDSSSISKATLSRATLYAELAAYQLDDPSTYSQKPRTSTSEAALVNFFQSISRDHHRTTGFHVAKNTASRPLTAGEINDRLRLRTLTLVGGGINKSTPPPPQSADTRPRKRRKRARAGAKEQELDQSTMKQQAHFLEQLNDMWNDYLWDLVGGRPTSQPNVNELSTRILQVSPSVEWIGSRVRLDECRAHPAWVGRSGILVDETAQTWRLVERTTATTRETTTDATTAVSNPTDSEPDLVLKTLVVPKRHSLLAVLLPLPHIEQSLRIALQKDPYSRQTSHF